MSYWYGKYRPLRKHLFITVLWGGGRGRVLSWVKSLQQARAGHIFKVCLLKHSRSFYSTYWQWHFVSCQSHFGTTTPYTLSLQFINEVLVSWETPFWCFQQNLIMVFGISTLHMQYKINAYSRTFLNIPNTKKACVVLNISLSKPQAGMPKRGTSSIKFLSWLPFLAYRIYVMAAIFDDQPDITLPYPLLRLVVRKWQAPTGLHTYIQSQHFQNTLAQTAKAADWAGCLWKCSVRDALSSGHTQSFYAHCK